MNLRRVVVGSVAALLVALSLAGCAGHSVFKRRSPVRT
jgi:hypothetical protein